MQVLDSAINYTHTPAAGVIEVLGVSLGCLNTGRGRGSPGWKSRVGAQEEGAWPGAALAGSSFRASSLSLLSLPLNPTTASAQSR